ncbi:unnamed protein product [Pleuronectes platessa]|uniref:Uncharacterized protein n=1 Tax=Pleuronectes platessa TaxID=8262 RepID=A0A9N7YA43_PLEPL|nr:unnamed protein product [Pleuronectes platessa]
MSARGRVTSPESRPHKTRHGLQDGFDVPAPIRYLGCSGPGAPRPPNAQTLVLISSACLLKLASRDEICCTAALPEICSLFTTLPPLCQALTRQNADEASDSRAGNA